MKIVFGLLLVALLFVGFAYTKESKEEVQEVVEFEQTTTDPANQDLSILDTVKYIKSKRYARSLQGDESGKQGSSNADDQNKLQAHYQYAIWIPIILGLALLYAVMAIFYMDFDKDQDTLIYAKFITSYK